VGGDGQRHLYCGATPVFVDVDRATYNIDPMQVASKLTPRTKAIIAVHLFGLCADINAFVVCCRRASRLSRTRRAPLARAPHDSRRRSWDAAAFSFHPRKSITTAKAAW